MEPETVYYPLLNTEDSISRRSLSVLTLFHMCSLPTNDDAQVRRRNDAFEVIPSSTAATTAESEGETQQATIFRFIMLILDGLVDMQSRQQFQSLLQTQPKERYNTFKKSLKKTGFGVVMRMRPVFTEEEETLLMPAIKQSYHSQHILQILQSVSLGNPRIRHQKKEELYFY
ncbi:hypothetical protein BDF20DRAFT_845945 [Mycotypha africana]|uniref:uncharacterized protein n=1 Tax=Mycotypha africana TaxID=64632 RepID=UPI0023016F99|nr:uncharacterized protein BDF20DRAFT_845945 [Mycotypha africana]KAI8991714.1 hypothetical protein BDF20DRAFT_845945 [Mycotypha africana]